MLVFMQNIYNTCMADTHGSVWIWSKVTRDFFYFFVRDAFFHHKTYCMGYAVM